VSALSDAERLDLRRVCEKWDVPPHVMDAMDVDLFAAVETILTTHAIDPEWEARAVIAEAQVAQIRDMFSETRWLEMSMLALHQIRDRILGALDSWERA
jgi:hypothetical protein